MSILSKEAEMNRRRLEIHLEKDMYDDIKVIALETGKSISDVVRDFANTHIDSHKKRSKKFTELRKLVLTP
jgi:metal-responsive CopG/Arc/MetJ family transcriptional regulator